MPKWLGAIVFFGTVLVAWGSLHAYLYARFANSFDLGPGHRLALRATLAALALLYLAGRLADYLGARKVAVIPMWVGAYWLGLLSILITALLMFDVWVALPGWVLRHSGAITSNTAKEVSRGGLGVVLGVSCLLAAWGTRKALAGPEVTLLKVPLPNLPPHLDGFSIAVASDIHVGDLVTQGYLDNIIQQLSSLHADLVVLVGDLSDERYGADGVALRKMAGIQSKHGVIAVTGNHEYYTGAEVMVQAIQAAGIPVLRQTHRVVADSIVVAGVDDPTFLGGRRKAIDAIDKALEGRDRSLPLVLLSHQPLAVHHAADSGVDLMLSGHTHGGQIPPFQLITGLAYSFLSGLYEVRGMRLYVNNGAGFWGPPIRLFANPEIVHVKLVREQRPAPVFPATS